VQVSDFSLAGRSMRNVRQTVDRAAWHTPRTTATTRSSSTPICELRVNGRSLGERTVSGRVATCPDVVLRLGFNLLVAVGCRSSTA